MKLTNLRELFIHELGDLYDAEIRISEALETFAEKADSDELKHEFESHKKDSQQHTQRIEKIFEQLGEEPTRETCHATVGLIKEAESHMAEAESPQVRDALLISHAQRIEHYEMAGYGALRTYALHLDERDAAETLQKSLDEEGNQDKVLTKLANKANLAALS